MKTLPRFARVLLIGLLCLSVWSTGASAARADFATGFITGVAVGSASNHAEELPVSSYYTDPVQYQTTSLMRVLSEINDWPAWYAYLAASPKAFESAVPKSAYGYFQFYTQPRSEVLNVKYRSGCDVTGQFEPRSSRPKIRSGWTEIPLQTLPRAFELKEIHERYPIYVHYIGANKLAEVLELYLRNAG